MAGGFVGDRLLWGVGLLRVPAFHSDDLPDDFPRGEVSLPSIQTAGAEAATVGAAHLCRHAEGMAVSTLAVQGGVGGYQNTFDQSPVL